MSFPNVDSEFLRLFGSDIRSVSSIPKTDRNSKRKLDSLHENTVQKGTAADDEFLMLFGDATKTHSLKPTSNKPDDKSIPNRKNTEKKERTVADILKEEKKIDTLEEFAHKLKDSDPSDILPDDRWNNLLPHQQRYLRFMISEKSKLYVAVEQGLGKTPLAVTNVCYNQLNTKDALPVLVVCPGKTKKSWAKHFRDFANVKDSMISLRKVDKAKVVIITWQTAVKYEKEIKKRKFNTVIIDEARQSFCNDTHSFVQTFSTHFQTVRYFLPMSGTPFDRHIHIWSIFHCLHPELIVEFYEFTRKYCGGRKIPKFEGSSETKWDCSRSTNPEQLLLLLRKCGYRYIKTSIKDKLKGSTNNISTSWPAATHHQVLLSTVSAEKTRYYCGLKTLTEVQTDLEINDAGFFDEYNRVIRYKVPLVINWLDKNTPKGRGLIFHDHKLMGDAIEIYLCRKFGDNEIVRIDGSCNDKKSAELMDRFQQKKGPRFAILSIRACGSGITMWRAIWTVITELPWDYTLKQQVLTRADRIGQTVSVTNYYLIMPGSLDQKILDSENKKQKVVQALNG